MAVVDCNTEYRISFGAMKKGGGEVPAASAESGHPGGAGRSPPHSLPSGTGEYGLDPNPIAVCSYEGPDPSDTQNFRDFVNFRWAQGKRDFGAEYMFISRHMYSTTYLENMVLTGAIDPTFDRNSADLILPVFCCFTDQKVHVSINYVGRPTDDPEVRVVDLRLPPPRPAAQSAARNSQYEFVHFIAHP